VSPRAGADARVYLYLLDAGDHMAPQAEPAMPLAVLEAEPAGLRFGANGLFYAGAAASVSAVHLPGGRVPVDPALPLAFEFFTAGQRAAARACAERLAPLLGEAAGALWSDAVFPLVAAVTAGSELAAYHFCDTAAPGVLFLRYHSEPLPPGPAGFAELAAVLAAAHPARAARHHVLNDDCWYSRLPAGDGLTTRLVLRGDADPWALAVGLHGDLAAGAVAGHVPELDRSFRVYDYEAHAFEAAAPGQPASLLVIAPGWDGTVEAERVTVAEDGGVRRTRVTDDAPAASAEVRARRLAGAEASVTPVASARRRRFEVHAESLETGAIHCISFELARGRGAAAEEGLVAECQVAYRRSRTLQPMPDPGAELRTLSAEVRARLRDAGIESEEGAASWAELLGAHPAAAGGVAG
jgi:hypothetical protein